MKSGIGTPAALERVRVRKDKNCFACRYSYMEPDSDLICGHPDSGVFGKLVLSGPVEHCGPEYMKFEQHPLRNADGSLKNYTPA